MTKLLPVLLLALSLTRNAGADESVRIGSKAFTESYILAEIAAQVLEGSGAVVARKPGLGGTGILFQALASGNIDLYPEYTGTISEAMLKEPSIRDLETIRSKLAPLRLAVSAPLGFNNTYALAVRKEYAERNQINQISDLARDTNARAGFSNEFMKRADGYPALAKTYSLRFSSVSSMEHSLTYEALKQSAIDVTDAYSTDAKISGNEFVTLVDDLHFFPSYYAVFLAREEFVARNRAYWERLNSLAGTISEDRMKSMNAEAELGHKSFRDIARALLGKGTVARASSELWWRTKQHLGLVSLSLLASILAGVPLGVAAAKRRALGQLILVLSGVLQTIPSLALLCFLIPVFGIGTVPALVALFLYGLLPIVLGTYTGITTLDRKLIESAEAIGLSAYQRLAWIELPLASPMILSGVKASTVIGIGTATLAALIGAGGYGAPIVTGLALNSPSMMLEGAVPAAGMALLAHFAFEAGRYVIPRGIR